jgi:NAD(P)-dependent dehydrogenase (short-subunit alcohol dehydrogenase family)
MTAHGLLDGRRALITGAAQGIGLAIAKAYLAEGASVAIADVMPAALAAAEADLCAMAPGRVCAITLDVTDELATEAAVAAAADRLGGLDVAVANAGILVLKPVVDLELAEWRRVIDVNLTGAFLTARAFARHVRAAEVTDSRLILTSSLFGVRGGQDNGAYSASKFGMIGLMQCLAAEMAPSGMLVNCVCPGQVESAMLDRLFEERAADRGTSAAALKAAFTARIPLGRLGPTQEIADAYVYLASRLSRYVNGQSIVVDGGWQVG